MPIFPKRTFTHLSLEWIGCFFLVLVRPPATNDSLRGNRTIERWMEMPLHNAGTEWEKCNYFNSVIRRVKCGDIVKLYMFFSPAACRCYSSFWVATFEYICLRLFFFGHLIYLKWYQESNCLQWVVVRLFASAFFFSPSLLHRATAYRSKRCNFMLRKIHRSGKTTRTSRQSRVDQRKVLNKNLIRWLLQFRSLFGIKLIFVFLLFALGQRLSRSEPGQKLQLPFVLWALLKISHTQKMEMRFAYTHTHARHRWHATKFYNLKIRV